MILPSGTKLYSFNEVPVDFQESFILSGYRSPRSSISQCILSALQPTNETLNIWTHLIPAVYFGWKGITFWQSLDELSLPYLTPLVVYMVTLCGFLLASMLAHVFNAMSDKARHVCFFVDYWAVSLFAFSSALAFRAYSFTESQLNSPYIGFYVPCAAFICCASLLISCCTRLMKAGCRRKTIRFASFAVPYVFDVIPLICRLVFANDMRVSHREADYFYIRHFIFAFLSAFLYCSHIPERLFPGKFDIIGHSHQLFHILSAFCSRDTLLALIQDSGCSQPPSGASSFSAYLILMAVVIFINSIVVLYYVSHLESSNSPPATNYDSGIYKYCGDKFVEHNHKD